MSIDSDISKLEQDILDAIGGYEDTVPKRLAALVSDIQSDLKAGRFKNRTGRLRRTMQAKLIDESMSISMMNYGYYLSFGVNGKNRANALGLPNEVAPATGWRSRADHRRGRTHRRGTGLQAGGPDRRCCQRSAGGDGR